MAALRCCLDKERFNWVWVCVSEGFGGAGMEERGAVGGEGGGVSVGMGELK